MSMERYVVTGCATSVIPIWELSNCPYGVHGKSVIVIFQSTSTPSFCLLRLFVALVLPA